MLMLRPWLNYMHVALVVLIGDLKLSSYFPQAH